MPFTLQTFQHGFGVTAIAKGGIQPLLSLSLNLKKINNFFNADRDVHTGGCSSLFDNVLDHVRILFRLMLFIFFLYTVFGCVPE